MEVYFSCSLIVKTYPSVISGARELSRLSPPVVVPPGRSLEPLGLLPPLIWLRPPAPPAHGSDGATIVEPHRHTVAPESSSSHPSQTLTLIMGHCPRLQHRACVTAVSFSAFDRHPRLKSKPAQLNPTDIALSN
jgi:hypothetical protein